MPLKGIPPVISPDLLFALAKAGHGDEICLADAFFPASSVASAGKAILIRCDGIDIPTLLKAILKLIELDTYVYAPVTLMELTELDKRRHLSMEIWDTYAEVLAQECGHKIPMAYLERFDFYDRAKEAFIVIQTGETAMYGNMILRNGVISPNALVRPPRLSRPEIVGGSGDKDVAKEYASPLKSLK